jgi:hypothetical protein
LLFVMVLRRMVKACGIFSRVAVSRQCESSVGDVPCMPSCGSKSLRT